MIHEKITIQMDAAQRQAVDEHNRRLMDHLEQGLPLKRNVLTDLRDQLTQIVHDNPAWMDVLKKLDGAGDHYLVQLVHADNEVLNLPWSMAQDPVSGQALSAIDRLMLSKCPAPLAADGEPPALNLSAPPLKVLVMISSPDDGEYKSRLSYEEEEFLILQALAPLMERGQVQVDFTDDGSLEALARMLATNRYHALHFSGHAAFKDGQGRLQLEHPLTLKAEMVPAREFAETVNCNPDYRVPLVVLSSCQSAQGTGEKGLHGITNQLLKMGVPAVVSMGASVSDRYASLFAGRFYDRIAQQQNVPSSFQQAVAFMREQEYQDQVAARVPHPEPLQWIIPNLYLRGHTEHLVDWQLPQEPLRLSSHRYITQGQRLVLAHEEGFRFIGRRRDKARIMPTFFERQPILLKGQGGVGKTAMAEHLIQRAIAADPRTEPFVFTESTTTIQEFIETLKDFLIQRDHFDARTFGALEKAHEKLAHLVARAAEVCTPIFVFDNLESFQTAPGASFAPEHQDTAQAIDVVCRPGRYYAILTGRYSLPDFPYAKEIDLNQVGVNDFWRRALSLIGKDVARLAQPADAGRTATLAERAGVDFFDVVKLLHGTFGGNYRALEMFARLFQEAPDKGAEALKSLEAFQQRYAGETEQVRQAMAQNLMFGELLALATPEHLTLLALLQNFRIPVLALALHMQLPDRPIASLEADLLALQDLTLIEMGLDPELRIAYYYVTPLVRDLLVKAQRPAQAGVGRAFSHQLAGAYHYHAFRNEIAPTLTELEEAFFHFHEAENGVRVEELGEKLSGFYYDASLFANALHYAEKVHRLLGERTPPVILNRLGLIYHLNGRYDLALELYERARVLLAEAGDKKGEGATLNNLATTAHAQGDYGTALQYLQDSLLICREIGDKAGEGATLNNLSQIYDAQGDTGTALQYLQDSLKIMREIGNKAGEGTTLNNLSLIYKAQGDTATALQYLQDSLKIVREIGNKAGEGATLGNIGQIYYMQGDHATALKYFQDSLKIRREIGDKAGEGTTLNNISQIHRARGDNATALKYLQDSLLICREIGDKAGAISTLHNMGMIARRQKDMQKHVDYEMQAYALAKETGNAEGLFHVGPVVGQILVAMGKKQEGLAVLRESLRIGREAGMAGTDEIERLIQEMEKEA